MALVTITELRETVRDYASRNKIFVEREFSDTELTAAIYWGLEYTKALPPFITDFDPDTMPKYIQLLAALYQVFFRESLFLIRNQSQLTEQGVPVSVGENANLYAQLASGIKAELSELATMFKRAQNLDNMTNYVASPYYSSTTDTDDDGGSYH